MLLPGALSHGAEKRELSEGNLRITCPTDASARAWQRFAAACVQDVDEFSGLSGEPLKALRIRFGEAESQPVSDPLSLTFTPDDTMEVLTHGLLRALLQRRLMSPGDTDPPLLPAVDWLVAALTNRVLFGDRARPRSPA